MLFFTIFYCVQQSKGKLFGFKQHNGDYRIVHFEANYPFICVCVCVFYSDLVCHVFRSFTQSWVSSLGLCGNESATLIQLNTRSQFRLLLFYWSSLICPFNSLVYPSNLALLSFSASWKTEPGSFSPVTVWRLQGCLESLTNVIFNPANGIEGVIMVPMWLNSCLYVAIHQRKTILWCVSNLWCDQYANTCCCNCRFALKYLWSRLPLAYMSSTATNQL